MGNNNQLLQDSYELDPEFENSIDVVVQHMVAAGFEKKEIARQLRVTEEFIKIVCSPGK